MRHVEGTLCSSEVELAPGLRHERASRIGKNHMLEVLHRAGRSPFAAKRPRPLELGLRRLRAPTRNPSRCAARARSPSCRHAAPSAMRAAALSRSARGVGHLRRRGLELRRGTGAVAARERQERAPDVRCAIHPRSAEKREREQQIRVRLGGAFENVASRSSDRPRTARSSPSCDLRPHPLASCPSRHALSPDRRREPSPTRPSARDARARGNRAATHSRR